MIFFYHYWVEITPLFLFFVFFCLIKWFFHEDLSFILFFVLSSFYRHWFIIVLSMFGFLLFFRHGVIRYLVTTFYLYDCDSNKRDCKPPNFGGL